MLTKQMLKEFEGLEKEIQDIDRRLKNMNKKESTTLIDSVKASSKYFPYTEYNITVHGIPGIKNKKNKHKYEKMLKSKRFKLEKKKLQIEYELNYVKDEEIRKIIRHRYQDQKTWLQVMFEMKYNSESTAKVKLKRFLEKL